MQIRNRQHILAMLAIGAVALLAGERLLISPLLRSWKDRAARIEELRLSVERGTRLLEREETVRQRWETMSTNTLPSNVSAAENVVLKAFDRWSQESRISVTSLKPQSKQTEDDYVTVECRADAFGSIQALTRFLYEVEKDPLALKVESVEISTRDNDGQQLALGLQVSGLVLNPGQP